jgi:hypothetical protein
MLKGLCAHLEYICALLYVRSGKKKWILMWRLPTGGAAEVHEKVDGTRVGVAHKQVV